MKSGCLKFAIGLAQANNLQPQSVKKWKQTLKMLLDSWLPIWKMSGFRRIVIFIVLVTFFCDLIKFVIHVICGKRLREFSK